MGMSTHVSGYKPPDDLWKQMKAAYDACLALKIAIPGPVAAFFNGDPPDEAGVEVSQKQLIEAGAVSSYRAQSCEGFVINVKKIPSDVTIIRVYNAY